MGKKDLDAGTDIYSFGVMLYEMVVGQVPFSADTPFSIIHDHIYTPLPLPTKVNPKVPEPVQRVLFKALAKDRLDRYDSTEELMTAFKDAWTEAGVPMQGTAIIMRSTMSKDKTRSKQQLTAPEEKTAVQSPARKGSRWVWAGVGLILLLCLVIVGLAIRSRMLKPAAPTAVQIPTQQPVQPALPTNSITPQKNLLDDFEGASLPGSLGWLEYSDATPNRINSCIPTSEVAYGGTHSLLFQFETPSPDGWATCGLYFDSPQDWSAAMGISFRLRSEKAGIPFRVDFYKGNLGALESYTYMGVTPKESVDNWALINVRWNMAPGVEWQANAGQPFETSKARGFAIGYSASDGGPKTGSFWLDDVSLFTAPPPPLGEAPSEQVRIAQEEVAKQPEDPDTHLTLALALWDSQEVRPAIDELNQAINLAGLNNQEFLTKAAEKFVKREAWMPASVAYLRLASIYGKDIPLEIENNFHEAVYKASEQKDAQLNLYFDRAEKIDKPISAVARGRQALFQGNVDAAKKQAAAAESLKPNMPEAKMLNAEIAMKTNNKEEAKKIMLDLASDPKTPEWLRIMAERHLKLIK
jgi:cytochrome c-type biogenesis protein CcmH/NrfG